MKNFDAALNYYVYKIEINENVIYVGKGKNQRAWSHLKEAELYAKADNAETENLKCKALNTAKENGDKIEITKIKEHLNEWQALSLEAEYIDFYWDTQYFTNKVRGIKAEKRCAVLPLILMLLKLNCIITCISNHWKRNAPLVTQPMKLQTY